MVAIMLMMLVGGVGLVQAVSDPQQVTLRWLRLGGIIALALLAVATTASVLAGAQPHLIGALLLVAVPALVQLITVQRAMRLTQRVAAAFTFLLASMAGALLQLQQLADADTLLQPATWQVVGTLATACTASGVMGGYLMSMLLGHAYLTAGNEMTQKPFARLVLLLGLLLALRLAASLVWGLLPYLAEGETAGLTRMWTIVMATARYAVGLAVPGVFTWMTLDCVRRHANQSATGILYVGAVLILIGEGVALGLTATTSCWF